MARQISNAEKAARDNAAQVARTRQGSRETTPEQQRVAHDDAAAARAGTPLPPKKTGPGYGTL